ncbi:MAG: hypothetical protein WCP01_03740 [Methylococcaceae bacterium]
MIKSPENTQKNELVACCNSIGMQHATNCLFNATDSATSDATNSLKALSRKVLERNQRKTDAQLIAKNHATNCPKKTPISCIEKTPSCIEIKSVILEVKNTEIELKKCGDCLHFKCLNKHGRGAGLCKVGANFYGLWFDSIRECELFKKLAIIL